MDTSMLFQEVLSLTKTLGELKTENALLSSRVSTLEQVIQQMLNNNNTQNNSNAQKIELEQMRRELGHLKNAQVLAQANAKMDPNAPIPVNSRAISGE